LSVCLPQTFTDLSTTDIMSPWYFIAITHYYSTR